MEIPPSGGDRPPFDPNDVTHETQLQAYYTGIVDGIDARLDEGEDPAQIEGYLTSGGYCHIFYDASTNAVIKMPRVLVGFTDPESDENDEDVLMPPEAGTVQTAYKAPLERGRGVPGLEQIITVVDDNGQAGRGAVICEFVSGVTLSKILGEGESEGENPPMFDEHYDRLIETLIAMSERGLIVDGDASNIIYDPDKGFTIIDYPTIEHTQEQGLSRQGDIMSQLKNIAKLGGMLHPSLSAFHVIVRFGDAIERRFGRQVASEMFSAWYADED